MMRPLGCLLATASPRRPGHGSSSRVGTAAFLVATACATPSPTKPLSDSEHRSETHAEDSCTSRSWWIDADGDRYGAGPVIEACTSPDPRAVPRDGDCDDTRPEVKPGGLEGDASTCHDGLDNDCSGATDCAEAACQDSCLEDCANGIDDDLDGVADCEDADCDDAPECQEDCANGIDDDLDGRLDCEDAECSEAPECQEDCTNGSDDDLDGSADCDDEDCWGTPPCISSRATVQGGHIRTATRDASSLPFSTSRQLVVESASGWVSTYRVGSGWQQCGWQVQPWSTTVQVSSTGGELFTPRRAPVSFTGSCAVSSAALPSRFLVNASADLPIHGYSSSQLARWYTGSATSTWTTGTIDSAVWRRVPLGPSDPWIVH